MRTLKTLPVLEGVYKELEEVKKAIEVRISSLLLYALLNTHPRRTKPSCHTNWRRNARKLQELRNSGYRIPWPLLR